jgi:hypothetical protein
MSLDDLIKKIPKPVLVLGAFVISIGLFVYNDPLKNECEVQSSIFEKKTLGLLESVRQSKSGKIQFPKIDYWKDRCKEGNSVGACDDYLEGLRGMIKEMRNVSDMCQMEYAEKNERFLKAIKDAIQVIPLVAWGEKPPAGLAERLGWLTEDHVRTFCYLKKTFIMIAGDENFQEIKERVYSQYPGEWPNKYNFDSLINAKAAEDKEASSADKNKDVKPAGDKEEAVRKMIDENRPRAYKSLSNPSGQLTKDQVYERSLFSMRCDLYM